jgi:pyridoxine 4-dehydrogenase
LTPRNGNELPQEETHAAMRAAIQTGCTIWNGGLFYGTPTHNSLTILRNYFQKYPEDAAKVELNIKGCMKPGVMLPDGTREGVMRDVKICLDLLPPEIKKIDMFEPARIDKAVPLEETFHALKECQDKGWIGGVALSEVGAETIKAANKIVKIVAVENELSLWETSALTNGVVETCADLGIPLHA